MTTSLFRYVALGDSTGVGVGSNEDGGYPERLFRRLKASGVNAGILNLCQSGATTGDVLRTQAERGANKRPALITLGIGSNDLWRMVDAAHFRVNLNGIADVLQRSGARVVVCGLSDLSQAPAAKAAQAWLGVTPEMIHQRVLELNALILELRSRPRFEVVDLLTASNSELAKHPEYFCSDGFHPSPLGYDRWAEICWPAVERAASAWRTEQETSVPLAEPS